VDKRLYNIETDTLITLYPKSMVIEVKRDFIQSYHLNKTDFTILYLLVILHPGIVTYQDFFYAFSKAGIDISSNKDIDKIIIKLRKELRSYKVKNFIIKIKKTGYAISNKWIEPSEATEIKRKQKFLKVIKKFLTAFKA